MEHATNRKFYLPLPESCLCDAIGQERKVGMAYKTKKAQLN